ncbi:hypothetical protein B0H11DRAFT_2260024 [Mycena galericulata]|nr:hypothetical protein B0H11DRAFT_2260024 [Mycena galericulata]
MIIQPHLAPPSSVNIGDVVLKDFHLGLEAVGLLVGSEIQHFLDALQHGDLH